MAPNDIPLGTIGVTPTYGDPKSRFVGSAIRWTTATRTPYQHGTRHRWTNATVNHAAIHIGGGQLVQAEPGGAEIAPADSDGWIWLTHIGQLQPDGTLIELHPTDQQRHKIADTARALVGTPYNWLDILAIALAQQRFRKLINPASPPWWYKRVGRPDRMICSQLADYCWAAAGLHLFADGRQYGLCSPGDLAQLAVKATP